MKAPAKVKAVVEESTKEGPENAPKIQELNSEGSNFFTSAPEYEELVERMRTYVPIYSNPYKMSTNKEEEDEEEEVLSPRRRASPVKSDRIHSNSGDITEKLGQLLSSYIETKDRKYLIRFLFKSGVLDTYSSSITYICSPSRVIDLDVEANRKAERDIRNLRSHIAALVMDFGISQTESVIDIICDNTFEIIKKLYATSPVNIFRSYIDNSEVYLEVLREFNSRNISIDPDYLEARNTNFSILRSNSTSISVIYAECLGELILCSRSFDMSERFNYYHHYNYLEHLPILNKTLDVEFNNKDRITINGTEYSMSAFESMVESSIEEFLNNLGVETYMNDKEITIATGAVGNGDTDSRKVVELL